MRTLDEILKNVTAGGKWFAMLDRPAVRNIAEFATHHDSAYAARAARNFPALVRALDLALSCSPKHRVEPNWIGEARAALNDALKD